MYKICIKIFSISSILTLIIIPYTKITILANNDSKSVDLGIPPDSPFYFLQNFWEKLKLIFTFDAVEKLKYQIKLLNRRTEEIKYLSEKGKLTIERANKIEGKIKKLMADMQKNLNKLGSREDIKELNQNIKDILERQQYIIKNALQNAPEKIQRILNSIIEISRQPLPQPPNKI
jgi:ElaB/YqjD/DUF883 family membrane-anchored ribosome-binding protein